MSNFDQYKELKERLKRDQEEANRRRTNEKKLKKKLRKETNRESKPASIKIKLKTGSRQDQSLPVELLNTPKDGHNKENEISNIHLLPSTSSERTITSDMETEPTITILNNLSPLLSNNNSNIDKKKTLTKAPKNVKKKSSVKSSKALEEKRKKDRERQRKRRANMSAENLEKKREYDRKYKEQKIADGTWKKYRASMSKREKRRDRKLVRDRVRKFRERKKQITKTNKFLENNTPPASPTISNEADRGDCMTPRLSSNNNTQKSRGRKKKNLNRSKIYRLLKKTENKLNIALRKADKFKKRYLRMKRKFTPSPNSKINKLAEGRPVPEGVRKRLLFTECVTQSLIEKKKELVKNPKGLNTFHRIIATNLIKKHKMVKAAVSLISPRTFQKANKGISRKWNYQRISNQSRYSIIKFYQEDIHSRILPGKKDFVTKKKIKKQKRLLLHSMKDLHIKYNASNSPKVSYSTFRKLKPFWVLHPKMSDRDTCACVKCSNTHLLANKAFHVGLLNDNIKDIIKTKVCDMNNKECMYQTCNECKNTPILHNLNVSEKNDTISYQQWQFVKIKKSLRDDMLVRVMQKNSIVHTKGEVIKTLENQVLPAYMEHQFKISHQYQQLKKIKSNIKNNEVYIHMDFSENFETKYHEEVQSMHFGRSKSHLSLHTVVVYIKEDEETKPKSYCTVSENTDHGAHAVWAHLAPIFSELHNKTVYDTVYIQSDGPTSQYKNRFNMFFFKNIANYFPGIKKAAWNFSVSGHGKGAADGVGGLVKRSADSIVKMGGDITDVKSFICAVYSRTQSVKLFEIPSQNIIAMKNKIPDGVPKIPQINKVHQVTWTEDNPNTLFTRELSCFECLFDTVCIHYNLDKGCINIAPAATKITSPVDDTVLEICEDVPDFDQFQIEDFNPGEWVLVLYEGSTYPGQIVHVNKSEMELTVNAMEPLPKNRKLFKWPLRKDIHNYPIQDILRKVNMPIPLDKRGLKYKFSDIN